MPVLYPNYSFIVLMISFYFYLSHFIDTLKPLPYFCFNYAGVPIITNLPLMRIPILEHNDYASFITWVVRTKADPFSLAERLKLFQRNLLEIGSTPEEG